MKKTHRKMIYIVGIACLFTFVGNTGWADKIQIRIATQMPPKHHTVVALEIIKKHVEQQTKGEIEINIHSGGQLFKGRELPMAVGSGAVEMGDMVTEYIANIFPELELLDGPFTVDSKELAQKAVNGPVGKLIEQRITKIGAKLILVHPYGYFSTYGNNKKEIKLPNDMNGMKIRAVGKSQILRAKAVGAIPQAIDGAEQFMAYKSGTVDIGQTGPTSFVARKLYEVFKYGVTVRDNLMLFWLTMNSKVYDKLTAEQKTILADAANQASEFEWSIMEKEELDADQFLEKNMKMHALNEAELKEWKKVLTPVNETLANDAGKAGKELYQELLKIR